MENCSKLDISQFESRRSKMWRRVTTKNSIKIKGRTSVYVLLLVQMFIELNPNSYHIGMLSYICINLEDMSFIRKQFTSTVHTEPLTLEVVTLVCKSNIK